MRFANLQGLIPVGWVRGEAVEVHKVHNYICIKKIWRPNDKAPNPNDTASIDIDGPDRIKRLRAWMQWWFE